MQTWKGQSDEDDCPEEKPRHLYLLLDEWSGGYSIRKINIDLFGDSNLGYSLPSASSKLEALPPALFKFEAPRGNPCYFAGAFGSKILAMQPMHSWFNSNSTVGVPVYDVHMRSLMIGPRQRQDPVDPIYIPVDGKLFALSAGSFQLLHPPPCGEDEFVWMWHTLPDPPFQREHVTSYAVHSDGRTIFVSIGGKGCAPATFSFDTTESVMRNTCMWKQLGQWQLPFHGRAYFVAELDALVGLSGEPGPSCRICSMDLISDKCDVTHLDQVVKFGKEGLFGSSIGATLVNIGGNRFCIVDFDVVDVPTTRQSPRPTAGDLIPTREQILRLTTFSLTYDKNGDLTTRNCRSREYIVPGQPSTEILQVPVASWTT